MRKNRVDEGELENRKKFKKKKYYEAKAFNTVYFDRNRENVRFGGKKEKKYIRWTIMEVRKEKSVITRAEKR